MNSDAACPAQVREVLDEARENLRRARLPEEIGGTAWLAGGLALRLRADLARRTGRGPFYSSRQDLAALIRSTQFFLDELEALAVLHDELAAEE